MMHFIDRLRELSGGKPTGFKFCIGHPWEWFAIAKAMQETGITPDFIVVDGAEGGTGAAPVEFSDHVGAPLQEGLLLVHNTLVGLGLRDRIKLGCAGKVITAFDIARMLALGADWCNAARGFMFALGCIQAQTCHTGHCPTGVTTQDPQRQQALVVPTKADRVHNFHRSTLLALKELVQAAGLDHPREITAHTSCGASPSTGVKLLANLLPFVQAGRAAARRDAARGVPHLLADGQRAASRRRRPMARVDQRRRSAAAVSMKLWRAFSLSARRARFGYSSRQAICGKRNSR